MLSYNILNVFSILSCLFNELHKNPQFFKTVIIKILVEINIVFKKPKLILI